MKSLVVAPGFDLRASIKTAVDMDAILLLTKREGPMDYLIDLKDISQFRLPADLASSPIINYKRR